MRAYREIWAAAPEQVQPPSDVIDYRGPAARLTVGGVVYQPAVKSVVRAFGRELVRIEPGRSDAEPSTISARFIDHRGNDVVLFDRNEWVGSTALFDLEVAGPRITARSALGEVPLRFRLEPPHGVAIERLDMLLGHARLMATERAWVIGAPRDDTWVWLTSGLNLAYTKSESVVFEVEAPAVLERRREIGRGIAQELFVIGDDRYAPIIRGGVGIVWPELGFSVASWCDPFLITGAWALYECGVNQMRQKLFTQGLLDQPSQTGSAFLLGSNT